MCVCVWNVYNLPTKAYIIKYWALLYLTKNLFIIYNKDIYDFLPFHNNDGNLHKSLA